MDSSFQGIACIFNRVEVRTLGKSFHRSLVFAWFTYPQNTFDVCLGSLSCWNTKLRPRFKGPVCNNLHELTIFHHCFFIANVWTDWNITLKMRPSKSITACRLISMWRTQNGFYGKIRRMWDYACLWVPCLCSAPYSLSCVQHSYLYRYNVAQVTQYVDIYVYK